MFVINYINRISPAFKSNLSVVILNKLFDFGLDLSFPPYVLNMFILVDNGISENEILQSY